MADYLGRIEISDAVAQKLREKHDGLGVSEVREAFQWPARPRAAWEDSELHGRRLVVIGRTYDGRELIGWLLPLDESDGTWILKSARYL